MGVRNIKNKLMVKYSSEINTSDFFKSFETSKYFKALSELFKSKLKFKNNKVTYDKFIEMAYAKK